MCFLVCINVSADDRKTLRPIQNNVYTSPEKSISCQLPVLDASESIEEMYTTGSEGIQISDEEHTLMFSHVQELMPRVGQFKHVKEGMNEEAKLLAIRRYWKESFPFDEIIEDNSIVSIDDMNFRYYAANRTLGNHKSSSAYLFSVSGSSIVTYLVSAPFKLYTLEDLKEITMKFKNRCKFDKSVWTFLREKVNEVSVKN